MEYLEPFFDIPLENWIMGIIGALIWVGIWGAKYAAAAFFAGLGARWVSRGWHEGKRGARRR